MAEDAEMVDGEIVEEPEPVPEEGHGKRVFVHT